MDDTPIGAARGFAFVRAATVTLILAAIVSGCGGGGGRNNVEVVDVVGDTQAAATTAITKAGLVLGTVTQQSSTTVAPARVLSETPAAGTSVASGTAVNLVVASATYTYTFSACIDGSDYLVIQGSQIQWQYGDDTPVGDFRSDCGPTTTTIQTSVNGTPVLTADWQPIWSPPPLAGGALSSPFMGLSPAFPSSPMTVTLTPIAARNSLTISQTPTAENNWTLILAFDDDPVAGATIYAGKVTVQWSGTAANPVVSSGPPVAVPNVLGDTQAAATTAITKAGLVLGAVISGTSDSVLSTIPPAGINVPGGSLVVLNLASVQVPLSCDLPELGIECPPYLVTIPNVAGYTQAAAATVIGDVVGLGTPPTYSVDASIPAQLIAGTTPRVGDIVSAYTTVSLVVSIGPMGKALPSVVGESQVAATTAITGAGFSIGTVTHQWSYYGAAGDVLSETPPGGTELAAGWPIDLVVSTGSTPQVVAVPNVLGDTQAAAASAITGAGFVVDTVAQQSSSLPSGSVISQSPAAYSNVAPGSAIALVVSSGSGPGGTASESQLYSFSYGDGAAPFASLIQGSDGNFYGTTESGGTSGVGTVFRVTPGGVESVLHSFTNAGGDGASPFSSLVVGSDNNFYGVTEYGGANSQGAVFKITPAGVETVLYSFAGSAQGDAGTPQANLILASDGNFYGTTLLGGANNAGAVFKITAAGAETTLYSFTQAAGGSVFPNGLTQGGDGNFYSTTQFGGTSNSGTVFKITPTGVGTVLYSFPNSGTVGEYPEGGLIQGSDGNFYGTTNAGGSTNNGTVFKITPAGAMTVINDFATVSNGAGPIGNLIQGSDGNFYGTTSGGGANSAGTVFMITPAGALSVLYSFGFVGDAQNFVDGQTPEAGVIQGSDGNFYGTTLAGGSANYGSAFKITPGSTMTTTARNEGALAGPYRTSSRSTRHLPPSRGENTMPAAH